MRWFDESLLTIMQACLGPELCFRQFPFNIQYPFIQEWSLRGARHFKPRAGMKTQAD